MGVPRLFGWLAERYPLCQRVVTDAHLPEFDNFYLDMNSIVHKCTHGDADVQLSEEQMFLAVFAYIEKLFDKVQPRRLLYLAVDGVAPRAKMNQQRSRRFKTALEAQKAAEKAAINKEVPNPFDSNCITPGTQFMVRLSARIRLFIEQKLREDIRWRGLHVIYSGHEVPGEGEHKIQQYLRELLASRKEHMTPLRHCLYGLDADLIVLALVSHEPNFCLIFEDVHETSSRKQTSNSEEQQNFRLMYLSLLREYFDLEFNDLRSGPEKLPFEYNLERIIDDIVAISYFIGNDFLPNIPSLYIPLGALDILFDAYKRVLRTLDGYIQSGQTQGAPGTLHLPRLLTFLKAVIPLEYEAVAALSVSHRSPKRQGRTRSTAMTEDIPADVASSNVDNISSAQLQLVQKMRDFALDLSVSILQLPSSLPVVDRQFVLQVAPLMNLQCAFAGHAESLHLVLTKQDEGEDDSALSIGSSDDEGANDAEALTSQTSVEAIDNQTIEDESAIEDEPASASELIDASLQENTITNDTALFQQKQAEIDDLRKRLDDLVLSYEKRVIKEQQQESQASQVSKVGRLPSGNTTKLLSEWEAGKQAYYQEKIALSMNADALRDWEQTRDNMSKSFIEGVQWTLWYYYRGVASWSWYYPFHYAPMVSDIVDFFSNRFFQNVKDSDFESVASSFQFRFDLGKPFRPYEQLLAVLPPRSAALLPPVLQSLMTSDTSPIKDMYPQTFERDQNGKKNDWEAVVLIPFIQEDLLLAAIRERESLLSDEEKALNANQLPPSFYKAGGRAGWTMATYQAPPAVVGVASSLTVFGTGASTPRCKALLASFPSLNLLSANSRLPAIKFSSTLKVHRVTVLRRESKGESIVLTTQNNGWGKVTALDVAQHALGARCFIHWPYLREAFCVGVSDERAFYEMHIDVENSNIDILERELTPSERLVFQRQVHQIINNCGRHQGVVLEKVRILLYCLPLVGVSVSPDGERTKQYSTLSEIVPVNLVVDAVVHEDLRYEPKPAPPFESRYPVNKPVLYVGMESVQTKGGVELQSYYGCEGTIEKADAASQTVNLLLNPISLADRNWIFGQRFVQQHYRRPGYVSSPSLAHKLKLSPLILSKITSSIVLTTLTNTKSNVGLNFKFKAQGLKARGYAEFEFGRGWIFSPKAVALITQYVNQFPTLMAKLQAKAAAVYHQTDLFENPSQLSAVLLWLKQAQVRSLDLVPVYSEELNPDAITAIQANQTKAFYTFKQRSNSRLERRNRVPIYSVITSDDASSRLHQQVFLLGDRVVSTGTHSVPFGLKGIVVKLCAYQEKEGTPSTHGPDENGRIIPVDITVSLDAPLRSLVRIVTVPPFAFLNVTWPTPPSFNHELTPMEMVQSQPRALNWSSIISSS